MSDELAEGLAILCYSAAAMAIIIMTVIYIVDKIKAKKSDRQ